MGKPTPAIWNVAIVKVVAGFPWIRDDHSSRLPNLMTAKRIVTRRVFPFPSPVIRRGPKRRPVVDRHILKESNLSRHFGLRFVPQETQNLIRPYLPVGITQEPAHLENGLIEGCQLLTLFSTLLFPALPLAFFSHFAFLTACGVYCRSVASGYMTAKPASSRYFLCHSAALAASPREA